MDAPGKQVTVDPGHVIDALREQVGELSVNLAIMTARARQAEVAIAAASAPEGEGA